MIDYADDHYEMNVDRAKKALGWEPKHSIETTLPKMIDALKQDPAKWYQGNGSALHDPYVFLRNWTFSCIVSDRAIA